MAIRPPSRTTQLEPLPPEDDGPTPDELVDFGVEDLQGFVPPAGAPEPRLLAAADAVPIFRTDLQVAKGAGGGLFEVTDPASGRHFTLYEFELSIARMLDGRRHASDVIENGVRLGIPVDLDGLCKFVRQLWRYGFLATPGTPSPAEAEADADRPEREKWDEATRTLFQSGLRLVRQGRPEDAASYFQAVLDADPDNVEAAERLAAIERGETIPAWPIGRRGGGRAVAAAPRRSGRAIGLAVGVLVLAGAAAAGWVVMRRAKVPPVPPPVAIPAPVPKPPPPPAWRTAAVQRRDHPSLGAVVASSDGVVTWRKANGAKVKAGERLGLLRTRSGARAAAPVDPAAAARIKELEALAAQDPVYRDFLEKEQRALRRRRSVGVVRDLPILAPVAGVLTHAAANRARVARGSELASIVDDGAWIVDAFLDGEVPPEGASCELRGDAVAERMGCRLDAAQPQDGGSQLTLRVGAAEAPWLGRSRSLRVRIAPPGTPPEAGTEPMGEGAP